MGGPLPRYPVYVPSKGRAGKQHTATTLVDSEVPHYVVVEPQDQRKYEAALGRDRVLVLPENDRGLVYSRNWIRDHSVEAGADRHWQLDDDLHRFARLYRGWKLPCDASVALAVVEDFVDRYENVGLASFNSQFFLPDFGAIAMSKKPFFLNMRCYGFFLFLNRLPLRWRYESNEDTDMTLQVLAHGYCTILFNAFSVFTPGTMVAAGGQTEFYRADGRLRMARDLERVWPGVVETRRRFQRPQHYVAGAWTRFDTKLIRRDDLDWDELEKMGPDNYGMRLKEVAPVKNSELRRLLREAKNGEG